MNNTHIQPSLAARTAVMPAQSHVNRAGLLYLVITGVLVFQAIFTVYHGGLMVGNGYRIAQLEKQKETLSVQKSALQHTLAEHHSLLHIQSSDVYKEFQPMAGVVTLAETTAVASR